MDTEGRKEAGRGGGFVMRGGGGSGARGEGEAVMGMVGGGLACEEVWKEGGSGGGDLIGAGGGAHFNFGGCSAIGACAPLTDCMKEGAE